MCSKNLKFKDVEEGFIVGSCSVDRISGGLDIVKDEDNIK